MSFGGIPETKEAAKEAAERYIAANPRARKGLFPAGERLPLDRCALLLRHGGATTHGWRAPKAYGRPSLAEAAFDPLAGSIRQGGVWAFRNCTAATIHTAPRLRRR